jgi:hypothetical protein
VKKIIMMLLLGAFLTVTAASTIGCDGAATTKPTTPAAATPTKP